MIRQLEPMEVGFHRGRARIGSIQDGSSLFHSISYATSDLYRLSEIDRVEYARTLRDFIAEELESRIDVLDPKSPTLYDTLETNISMRDMVEDLLSSRELNADEYLEVISRVLNIPIRCYEKDDTIEDEETVKILRLKNGNYELILD